MKTIEVWAPVMAAPADSLKMPSVLPEAPAVPNDGPPVNMRSYSVSMSVLSKNLKEALIEFQQVINDVPKPVSGYSIDEIEINLGVNGNGGIALIGKMEVGMEAAIKVKIKKENK